MLGAAMPEAAVDEHGDPLVDEHNVRAHANTADGYRVVLAEAVAPSVESRADRDLGLGVCALVAAHLRCYRRRSGVRVRDPEERGGRMCGHARKRLGHRGLER